MTAPARTLTAADFVLARIAEDEAAARSFVNNLGEARQWRADDVGGTVRRVGTPPFGLPDVEATTATHMEAAHIARHDPARVLAQCEALRLVVELHAREYVSAFDEIRDRNPRCITCFSYPCPTLLALCQPFADHPDFDPAWLAS